MRTPHRCALWLASPLLVAACLLLPACDAPPAVEVLLAASNASPSVGDTLTITATVTRAGVPLAGRTVTWSVAPEGALDPAQVTSTTDADGVAQVTADVLQAIQITVRATVAGVTQALVLDAAPDTGPRVRLSLDSHTIGIGGVSVASVTVTLDGVAQPGESVALAVSDPFIASLDPVTATTGADGTATATLTGIATGVVQVSALWSGVSASADLTVQPPPLPEYVFVTSGPLGEILLAANRPGANLRDPGFDDPRIPVGVQRGGSLILAVDATFSDAYVIDMRTLDEAPFAPSNLNLVSPNPRAALTAGVAADGDRVVWLRRQAAETQIVSARLNGSAEQVLHSAGLALTPASLALSPDGTEVAYPTVGGEVRVLTREGASRLLDLGTSTGPAALDWFDDDTLVVAVSNYDGSARPGLLAVPTTGAPPVLLYDGGAGLRSTPTSVSVDGDANVIYDEMDSAGRQSDIVRLGAPDYTTRRTLVSGDVSSMRPALTRF